MNKVALLACVRNNISAYQNERNFIAQNIFFHWSFCPVAASIFLSLAIKARIIPFKFTPTLVPLQALLMLIWTFCGHKVPYSTLCVSFCPFCAPVAMPFSPRVFAKAKVLQVKATGYPTCKAEEMPVTCRASVQICNSTPHPDPVKPEMLISPRHLISLGICLSWLIWCLPFAAEPKSPVLTVRAGARCLPQLMGTKSALATVKHKEKKRNPTAFTRTRGALACLKMLCPAALSSRPRRAELEDRHPSSTGCCLGLWANFWVPVASGKTLPSRGAKAK